MEIQYHITTDADAWYKHFDTIGYMAFEITDTGVTVFTISNMASQHETDLDATGLPYTKQEI